MRRIVMTSLLLAAAVPLLAQPSQAQTEQSGGAVMCAWAIYVGIQQGTGLCELPPDGNDAALADAIERIEDFAFENTTQGINQQMLDDYRAQSAAQTSAMSAENQAAHCRDIIQFRETLLPAIAEQTEALLSVPREPLWVPCI